MKACNCHPMLTDDGVLHHQDCSSTAPAYDFPNSRRPAPKPTAKGMTDEEVRDAFEKHLRHIGYEDV